MKRSLLAIAVAVFFTVSSFAQEFEEGDKVINLGIGFGSNHYTGSLYNSSIPPISGSFEVGIKDGVLDEGSIGVGGYLGFSRYKYEYLSWGYNYTNIVLGARGIFHYPLLENLDTYTGLMLGFRVVSAKEFGDAVFGYNYSASSSGLAGAWFIGGRYYFSDAIAAMLELGYGVAYVNLGIAFKL